MNKLTRSEFLRSSSCWAVGAVLAGRRVAVAQSGEKPAQPPPAKAKPGAAITVQDFQDYVLKLKAETDHRGRLNRDEGLILGSPGTEVRGILTCWMATVDALQRAGAEGCNLVVTHEQFYFYPYFSTDRVQPQHLKWCPNQRRLAIAERHRLCVMRLHGTMDLLHNFDDFVELIGLKNANRGSGYARVFPTEETTVAELAARVKRLLKLDRVRVVGDLGRRVRCVGVPMGGLGLDSNLSYLQGCVERGADVLIGGEADEYGLTFVGDAGIPYIETGHFASENPGIINFTHRIQKDFPRLKVVTHGARPFAYC
jgi:putative NIF3 family GTP cyclohydrolase 1 type 2